MPGEQIILPAGVSLAILAFLLSLLPAGLFLWLWYLRRHDRPVPANMIVLAFGAGGILVAPAFWLEEYSAKLWQMIHPSTAHYFAGAVLPLTTIWDVLLPAIGTFVIVATVEEGLRYIVLRVWLRYSKVVDQVFDGLVIGIAMGLGFATIENTIYFFNLFEQGYFSTLVFVFFLRFLISTLAHISFGGLMGAFVARGVFSMYRPARFYWAGFFVLWLLHGAYDLFLGINQSFYAVFILLPPLIVLMLWMSRRDFFVIQRKNGHLLVFSEAPQTKQARVMRRYFKQFETPWNKYAPWLAERRRQKSLLRHLEEPNH